MVAQHLAAGAFTGGDAKHEIENLTAHFGDGSLSIGNQSGVYILITGMDGKPMALPRPVVNAIRLQPPAANPVSETGS